MLLSPLLLVIDKGVMALSLSAPPLSVQLSLLISVLLL
jgi:hypothetical protein